MTNDEKEFLDDASEMFPLTVLLSFLVVFVTIVILWWAKNRHKSVRRGESLLLCGLSNAGKTLLFTRLTNRLAKITATSVVTNRGKLTLLNPSSDRSSKTIDVIDIPGNLRIRQSEFNGNKIAAKAIVFLIDSTTINSESKDVADYLYDILREKIFRQQRLPLLIFCNKQDLSDEKETSSTIRRILENELTMKRRTRASSVAVHQGKAETVDDIGRIGKDTFEFSDVKDLQIEFMDGSVLGVERKPFAGQYDDEDDEEEEEEGEVIDSAGEETDAEISGDLKNLYQWIEKIWMK